MDAKQQTAVGEKANLLTVSPSPHAKRQKTTASLMTDVLLALVPATIWGFYIFGFRAAIVVALAPVSALLCELLTELLLHRPVTVSDGSALVTGLLLGLNLPASVPYYVPVVGAAFAIILVKQIFGGLGKNIVNPALAARVFLMLCWAGDMSAFPAAKDRAFDAVASATPLASVKAGSVSADSLLDLFFGRTGGCIGEISVLMLLIGGVYLLVRRVIRWHIPVAMLGTVALLSFCFPQAGADRLVFTAASLCSGGLVLGAIFMATDYVTSPVTSWGRILYGVGCGALVFFLRKFSGYNEGVSFAILIMNCLVWYIDMLTKPRVYGKPRRAPKPEKTA